MDIYQLSVNYLHEQDRILVRINTREAEEIRLWLTRRLCASWVPVLRCSVNQKISNAGNVAKIGNTQTTEQTAQRWTSEFKHLQKLNGTDFKTPFKSDSKTWPLGSEPLLVTTVRMTPHPENRLELAFEESLLGRTAQARGFQASLEPQLLHGFMHLLEQALDNAQWQATFDPDNGSATDSIPDQDNEEASVQAKPKYLH